MRANMSGSGRRGRLDVPGLGRNPVAAREFVEPADGTGRQPLVLGLLDLEQVGRNDAHFHRRDERLVGERQSGHVGAHRRRRRSRKLRRGIAPVAQREVHNDIFDHVGTACCSFDPTIMPAERGLRVDLSQEFEPPGRAAAHKKNPAISGGVPELSEV